MSTGLRFPSFTCCLLLLVVAAQAQFTPSDDTYVSTTAPTTIYGSAGALQVNNGGQTAFVRFDLSGLPSGLTSAGVTKATLKIYVSAVTTAGTFDVNRVNGPWSERSVNANMEPGIGSTIRSGVPVGTFNKNTYVLVDITPAVGEWLDGVNANYGVALAPESTVNFTFNSKENGQTSHAPELDIVFAGQGGTPGPQGPIGPQGPNGLQGPLGPQGLTGPAGPQGFTGATGAQGPLGPMGFTGPQGPQGDAGPKGADGSGFNFRNAFDTSVTYGVNDVVTYAGSTYVAIAKNQGGGTPDKDPSTWTLMAQQGAAGNPGATGPQGPIGPFGPQGPQGQTGPAGATGPQGPTGAVGATGVVTIKTFAGFVGNSIAGSATAFVFAGPTTVVTTTAGQRITGSAEAPLALASGGPETAWIDLCFQPSAGGDLLNFSGGNFSESQIGTVRFPYSAAGSIIPGAGTWNVGYCIWNVGTLGLNNNDFVNGWVIVTN